MADTRRRAALAAILLVTTAVAAAAGDFSTVYSFGASNGDARQPAASLVPQHDALYGLTRDGGTLGPDNGTVFKFDPANHAETLIHSFNNTDGFDPFATPVVLGSTMFGTTFSGGSSGIGLVFAVNINTGAEIILHDFTGQADGSHPNGIIQQGAFLYGTTSDGGTFGQGTVYRMDVHGNITTLHAFGATPHDGRSPASSLLSSNGLLYGTTLEGGTGPSSFGDGTVFSVDPSSGLMHTLYSFAGGADAEGPQAALIALNGMLYGTTQNGGSYGKGAVYAVNRVSGAERVMHSFGMGADGAYPDAPLLSIGNKLFGTTTLGGAAGGIFGGYGTVFVVDAATSSEQVLHSLNGSVDGYDPLSGLTLFGGQLYGTAELGGAFNEGTIFSFTP